MYIGRRVLKTFSMVVLLLEDFKKDFGINPITPRLNIFQNYSTQMS